MIVVMKSHASEDDIQNVIRMVEQLDYHAHIIRGVERTVVACVGEERGEGHSLQHLESVSGVERVMLRHLLVDDLEMIELLGREVLPRVR